MRSDTQPYELLVPNEINSAPEADEKIQEAPSDIPVEVPNPFQTPSNEEESLCRKLMGWLWIFISSMFITISTILGISVLALPVKTGESGFVPFVTQFTICLFAQIFAVSFAIEILQRTHSSMLKQYHEMGDEGSVLMSKGPSLHDVGAFYLWAPFQVLFDVLIYAQYICIMIAYALAASTTFTEAYALTFKTTNQVVVQASLPFFIFILAMITIFGGNFIRGFLSFLTSIKVTFLLVIVIAVGYLSGKVDQPYRDQWQYVMRPFLIGTTTLGNALAALPMLYGKIKPTYGNINSLRAGSIFGLCLTWMISILWTYFILKTVPQYSAGTLPSLQGSEKLGELATIPLVKIIQSQQPNLFWIAVAITIFIVYSLSVSFLTIGSALKQQVDGYAKWILREIHRHETFWWNLNQAIPYFAYLAEGSIYLFSYVLILTVALTSSKGLFIVLERFVSFCLNMVSGVFMSFIFLISRTKRFAVDIPAPMWPWISDFFAIIALGYFSVAVLWDIITTILRYWIDPLPF